jgi:hypothetical protein
VNLGRKARKVQLTLVQVQSDEHEPSLEKAAVHTLVGALHKAQVGVVE